VLAAVAVTAIVLAFFAVDTVRNEPATFIAITAIALLAILLDLFWKRSRAAHSRTGPRCRALEGRLPVEWAGHKEPRRGGVVSRWAIQDSNLGPLPYQRSALTD
jgi:hypothetical protein